MKQQVFTPESNPGAGSAGQWWRRFLIPLACALLCVAIVVPWIAHAAATEDGFDSVVSAIEQRYQVHATRIPFLFLASFVAGQATHGGVSSVRVAEFEHFDKEADGDELNAMVAEKLGAGWSRMIRSTSKHGGEQTLIFTHREGRRMALFILDLDGGEMDVVQVSVDPDHLNETIGKYDHHEGQESD